MPQQLTLTKKVLLTYFTAQGVYGFYRGFNNLYSKECIFTHQTSGLYVDRVGSGFASTVYHVNPWFQPFILYNGIRRVEKRLRNIEITDEDWKY